MSTLEFLHTCHSQRITLLSAIGVVDPSASTIVRFESHEVQPRLPYHVDFLVHVECMNNMIKHTLVDKRFAPFVMSLSCWKGLGSPPLLKFGTFFSSFDGRSFRLHGILPSL